MTKQQISNTEDEFKQDGKWPKALRRGPLEMIACLIITLGIAMLMQPFAMILYTWSFATMLTGTAMFMVVSKFPT